MSLERDIQLLYELGALRHMDRLWKRFLNADFANNAEHLFRVVWIALVIAKYEGATDTEKIVKMAIAHDIAESRTGDVDYISRQYVVRNEKLAIDDMLAGTVLEAEFKALLHEYEERQSLESKIVKDADNLDVDMELCEQALRGHAFPEWDTIRQEVRENRLFTATAKKMASGVRRVSPHAWHVTSPRNRLNGGDWKR